jgi:tetratricopeptide (TPR) repeat protein
MRRGLIRRFASLTIGAAVAIGSTACAAAAGGPVAVQEAPPQSAPGAGTARPPAEPKTPGLIDQELGAALAKIRERRIDEAFAMIKQEATKHPDWAPPRLILARMLFGTDQTMFGRRALEQCAAESPNHPDIFLTFGALALGDARISDAQLNFENVLKLADTGHWTDNQKRAFRREAHAGLVSVAEAREDWNGALAELGRWLVLDPKNGQARQRLGRALFHLGKLDDSVKELNQAVKDMPTLEPAGVSLAWLYNQKGNFAKAGECFDQAVKADPQNARARIAYASWLLEQGRAADAKASVDQAARLAPDSTDARRVQALVDWHLGDLASAEKILNPLHRDLPGDLSVTNLLALTLIDQNDVTKRARGLQLAENGARQSPRSHEILATLGWAHYRMGHLDQAEQALRTAVTGMRTTPDIAYFLAKVLFDRGNRVDALKLLESATKLPGAFAHRNDAGSLLQSIEK